MAWTWTLTPAMVWIGMLILFLVIEIITVNLTAIWFVGGSLAALILNALGVGLFWQIVAFFAVSIVLLIFTRPFAVKYINSNRTKTNYEGMIGTVIRISETVDNRNQSGKAMINGVDWTVRTKKDDVVLKEGTLAKVLEISGVKLIVEEYREE